MITMTRKPILGLLLALLTGCSCFGPGPYPDKQPVDCDISVLDQRGAPLVAVGGALLFSDGGYYRIGVLASSEVLESYPEQLRINAGAASEAIAFPVNKLLPACQALSGDMKAEYTPDGQTWLPVEVLGFRDDGVWVALPDNDTEVTVGYQSIRIIPQGGKSDTQ